MERKTVFNYIRHIFQHHFNINTINVYQTLMNFGLDDEELEAWHQFQQYIADHLLDDLDTSPTITQHHVACREGHDFYISDAQQTCPYCGGDWSSAYMSDREGEPATIMSPNTTVINKSSKWYILHIADDMWGQVDDLDRYLRDRGFFVDTEGKVISIRNGNVRGKVRVSVPYCDLDSSEKTPNISSASIISERYVWVAVYDSCVYRIFEDKIDNVLDHYTKRGYRTVKMDKDTCKLVPTDDCPAVTLLRVDMSQFKFTEPHPDNDEEVELLTPETLQKLEQDTSIAKFGDYKYIVNYLSYPSFYAEFASFGSAISYAKKNGYISTRPHSGFNTMKWNIYSTLERKTMLGTIAKVKLSDD